MKLTPERARLVYAVSEPALGPTEQVVAAVTGPSVGLADLEVMLKRLLPAVPIPTPPTPLGPAHRTPRTPYHAPPAREAARATATVTSAAEASADATAWALVVQDCFIRAPSVPDALHVFRAV